MTIFRPAHACRKDTFFDGSPEPASPVAVVRRQARAATFAAVHEPYVVRASVPTVSENNSAGLEQTRDGSGQSPNLRPGGPQVEQVRRLAEDDSAVALLVKTSGYTDYVCVGFDDREHTLAAGGESFVFTEYGYLRAQGGKLFTEFGQMIGTPAYMSPEQADMSYLDADKPCTWVGAFVYSHENDENIFVGALRFPGENLVLGRKVASFVEIYGRQIPVEEILKVTVTFGNLRVNGTPVERPSATVVYLKRVPDYAEAVAQDGQLVVKVGEPVPDRKIRRVELLTVK